MPVGLPWLLLAAGQPLLCRQFRPKQEWSSAALNMNSEASLVSVDGVVYEASHCLSLLVLAGQPGLGKQASVASAA